MTGRVDVAIGGLINSNTDSDMFKFTMASTGPLNIEVDPVSVGATLDAKVSLYDSKGTLLAVAKDNPQVNDPLSATITIAQAPAGLYYVKVQGTGRGSPMAVDPAVGMTWGYTNYGSMGHYTLTVSKPASAHLAIACTPSRDLTVVWPAANLLSMPCEVWTDTVGLTATWNWGETQSLWNVWTYSFNDQSKWIGAPAPDGKVYAYHGVLPGMSHQYNYPGTYNVSVTITDNNGNTAAQAAVYMLGPPTPFDFTMNTPIGTPKAPAWMTFGTERIPEQLWPGHAYTDYCLWNFGDGTPVVKGDCGISHMFTRPGTYVVSATAALNLYPGTLTHQITVQIQ